MYLLLWSKPILVASLSKLFLNAWAVSFPCTSPMNLHKCSNTCHASAGIDSFAIFFPSIVDATLASNEYFTPFFSLVLLGGGEGSWSLLAVNVVNHDCLSSSLLQEKIYVLPLSLSTMAKTFFLSDLMLSSTMLSFCVSMFPVGAKLLLRMLGWYIIYRRGKLPFFWNNNKESCHKGLSTFASIALLSSLLWGLHSLSPSTGTHLYLQTCLCNNNIFKRVVDS